MSFLGVLMLETRFARVPGDIGNPASFDFPVRYAVVAGASPQRVVRDRDATLLQPFIDAGRALVTEGAAAISTSCGFLALFQRELSEALTVPVWTSSLLVLPAVNSSLRRGQIAGVVTIDAAALGPEHFRAVGADPRTPIEGVEPGCCLQRTVLGNEHTLDVAAAQCDVVAAALRLRERHPEVGAIILECTNMAPYAHAVREATGVPVHDITTLVNERWHGQAAMQERSHEHRSPR